MALFWWAELKWEQSTQLAAVAAGAHAAGSGQPSTPLPPCEWLGVEMGMELVGVEASLSAWLLRGSISTGKTWALPLSQTPMPCKCTENWQAGWFAQYSVCFWFQISPGSVSSLRRFLKVACFFPSPTPFWLPPLNFKQNSPVDHFNLNSPALLVTTKHWLRWLIHTVILGRVCANKKCGKMFCHPNCGFFSASVTLLQFFKA